MAYQVIWSNGDASEWVESMDDAEVIAEQAMDDTAMIADEYGDTGWRPDAGALGGDPREW